MFSSRGGCAGQTRIAPESRIAAPGPAGSRLTMPLALRIMSLLGVAIAGAGAPVLLRPEWVRATFGLRASPQMTYILRIVGTMLASLGLILIVFAGVYWRSEMES